MQLSKHFTLAEMCATKTGLPNTPNQEQVFALEQLCENVLDKIRDYFGQPVIVSSGFRSPEVNAAVKGAKSSQHTKGEAADIHVKNVPNDQVWHYIVNELEFDQCIAEMLSESNGQQGWIHVSYCQGKLRKEDLSFIGRTPYVRGLKYAS